MYRDIYSLPPGERPADEVIEDDADLDHWCEARRRELSREYAKRRMGARGKGNWVPSSNLFGK